MWNKMNVNDAYYKAAADYNKYKTSRRPRCYNDVWWLACCLASENRINGKSLDPKLVLKKADELMILDAI